MKELIDLRIDEEAFNRLIAIDGVTLKQLCKGLFWIYYNDEPIGNLIGNRDNFIQSSLSKYAPLRKGLGLPRIQ